MRKTFVVAMVVVMFGVVGTARAANVLVGYDLWSTPSGGAVEDFGLNPIPADFFEPGSDPFNGVITFTGVPLGSFLTQPTGNADTIVQRLMEANLPDPLPASDTIDIEIVALSLISVAPITVTGVGPSTQWDVEVGLSNIQPSTTGTMAITHANAQGGTYAATINVCPVFTFTEVGNPSNIRQWDFCQFVSPAGETISVSSQPWLHDAQLPLVSPLSGPNFFVDGDTSYTGRPIQLGVPIESPTTSALDHYKCYKARDLKNPKFQKIRNPGVSLDDQFGPEADVDVIKPFLICNPASKNGSGINNPDAHLCCYKIKGQKLNPRPHVEIADQFGTLQLEAIKPDILCQPCSKTVLP